MTRYVQLPIDTENSTLMFAMIYLEHIAEVCDKNKFEKYTHLNVLLVLLK